MTLKELLKVVQDQSFRLLVYDRNDNYVETIAYSRYRSMFNLNKKEHTEAEEKLTALLKSRNVVKFLHSAEFYPDIGVRRI